MADTAGTPKDATATAAGDSKAAPKSSSSRKRKADELSDEETEETPPHLPAPVWGRVLDFMPYTEVRSALLVAKIIAVEAVQYVQTLNVMRGCELYVPAARRFGNVEEVNILCLLELTGEVDDDDGSDLFSMSLDVSNRAVPFLGSFAKLTRGLIGGLDSGGDRQIYDHDYVKNNQGGDLYRSLLSAYVGAIKTGALSENIEFRGIDLWSFRDSSCREESSNCQWCKDILSHFPLTWLLRFWLSIEHVFCQTEQEVWDIVQRRPGIDKVLSEVSEEVLCEEVSGYFSFRMVGKQFRAAAVEHLPEKWRRSERECGNLFVWSLSQSDLQELDELIEKGFDPKYITCKFALEEWRYFFGAHGSEFFAWTRTTVESLAARGFPVDCNCVPVIDDKYNGERYSD